MRGQRVEFNQATLAHIWPASYANFSDAAANLALPANFHNQPRHYLLLPKYLHDAFDAGRVGFIPTHTGFIIRVFQHDKVSAEVNSLDGQALIIPKVGAMPFKRILGWFAWLAKGACDLSPGIQLELGESLTASDSHEGNAALSVLLDKAVRTEKVSRLVQGLVLAPLTGGSATTAL